MKFWMKLHTLMLAGLLVLGSGCGSKHQVARCQWFTMGTVAAVQASTQSDAERARECVQPVFDEINRLFSTWQTNTEISAINQAAGTDTPYALSPDVKTVIATALSVSRASEGAFNPLVGSLMAVWGFGNGGTPSEPPSPEALQCATLLADWRLIQFNGERSPATLYLPRQGMKLDLGAIAKGYAVDVAFNKLIQAGHTNILIDLGGNLRAIGEAAQGRGGWRTGIRDPFNEGSCVAQFLLTNGQAVATSGNYERFVEIRGVRYAHIMDARTGNPVTGIAGVTVIAPTAMLADVLSTTLFVLGPEKGRALLKNYPNCEAVWIPDTPEQLTLLCTPSIAKRLTPTGPDPLNIKVL
jgi:thiamine biosynthesis lipoprotein